MTLEPWQEAHFNRMEKDLEDMETETQRKAAYEIRPATLGQIAKLFIETEGVIPLQYIPFTFTEKRTQESKVLLMEPGADPEKLTADELDEMWSQFAPKQ